MQGLSKELSQRDGDKLEKERRKEAKRKTQLAKAGLTDTW